MAYTPEVVAFAPVCDMTYPVSFYDATAQELEKVLAGKHPICVALKAATKPMIIVGEGVLARTDGGAIHSLCAQIAKQMSKPAMNLRDETGNANAVALTFQFHRNHQITTVQSQTSQQMTV